MQLPLKSIKLSFFPNKSKFISQIISALAFKVTCLVMLLDLLVNFGDFVLEPNDKSSQPGAESVVCSNNYLCDNKTVNCNHK